MVKSENRIFCGGFKKFAGKDQIFFLLCMWQKQIWPSCFFLFANIFSEALTFSVGLVQKINDSAPTWYENYESILGGCSGFCLPDFLWFSVMRCPKKSDAAALGSGVLFIGQKNSPEWISFLILEKWQNLPTHNFWLTTLIWARALINFNSRFWVS